MSKMTLTFDVSDPDEEREAKRAMKALDLALCLWDIDQELRDIEKYRQKKSFTREAFWEILNSKGVSLDELII